MIEDYVTKHGEQFLDDFLIPWLEIPSVSSDASRNADSRRAAEFLRDELESSGLEVQVIEQQEGSNPIVYAEKIVDSSLPTVLVYGHYDVQPINKPSEWKVDGTELNPFQPTRIGDRLYARGATDDKGQVAAHVLAMRYFAEHDLPCNIKFVIESNEEGGKASISKFVKDNADLLAADAILISDSGTFVEGYPTITTNLKGVVVAGLESTNLDDIIAVLHQSHDPVDNRTLIDSFYDGIVEGTIPAETERDYGAPEANMGWTKPETYYTQLAHRWYRPTNSPLFLEYANPTPAGNGKTVKLTAHGPKKALHSGSYGGPVQEPALVLAHVLSDLSAEATVDYITYGSRTLSTSIQPTGEAQINCVKGLDVEAKIKGILESYRLDTGLITVEEVEDRRAYLSIFSKEAYRPTAYLSYRVVSGQDAETVMDNLEDFVTTEAPEAEFTRFHTGNAIKIDTDNPYHGAVVAGLQMGYGTEGVHLMSEGGSIPIVSTLADTLNAPVILAGFSSPTDNLHAPNESILVETGILAGARSMMYALQEIGKIQLINS